MPLEDLLGRDVVGNELAAHAALTYAPGDQLSVLRSEIEHEDRPFIECDAIIGHRRAHRDIPTPCSRCSFLPSVCNAGANMISAFWNSWIVS